MGRVESRPRERESRLSFGPRRPAGPASSPFSFAAGLARGWRTGACALAAGLFLLLGAQAAQAHDDAAAGHVHLEDSGSGGCTSGCPHLPTGYVEPGPGHGQLTVHWTPATTGPAAAEWSVLSRKSVTSDSFSGVGNIAAGERSYTINNLTPDVKYDVRLRGNGSGVGKGGRRAQALGVLNALPPTVSSATVKNGIVTVNFDRTLKHEEGYLPSFRAWSVTVNGVKYNSPFFSARNEWNRILLWLHEPNSIHAAKPPPSSAWRNATISYDKTKARIGSGGNARGNPIQSNVGAEVASFTGQPVTNAAPQPKATGASVDGTTVTLTYDVALDEDSVPVGEAFHIGTLHGGGPGLRRCNGQCRVPVTAVSVSGSTVTLTLAEPIPSHAAYASVSYGVYGLAGGPPLRGAVGGVQVSGPLWYRANIRTANTPPVFAGARVRGSTLTLNFNEVLAYGATVPSSAFTVRARLRGGGTRTIRGKADPVRYGHRWANFTVWLSQAVPAGATVTLSYAKPASDPLRDRQGAALESFSGAPVTNGPARLRSLKIVSDPGDDDTYGRGDTVRVQATFDTPVRVGTGGGTPRVLLWLDPKYVQRWGESRTRNAVYEGGSDTDTLTFAYEVVERDRAPSGIGLGIGRGFRGPVILDGGRIYSWGGVDADVSHAVVAHNRGHRIDGSVYLPKLQSAAVGGTTLALTFDEALDASSVPAPGAFRVTVEGTRRHVASGGVAIDGKTVTLTLTTAVARGNTVTVGYTRPSANPLRDDIRDKVESFADKTVTNDTGVDPEGPPGNFWAAELTVGKVGNVYGCVDATTIPCSSGLKKNTLMHEDTTYQVVQLANIQGSLVFSLDKAIPTDWTLHLGNRKFPVAGAQLVDATIAAWSNPPSWTTGQEVSVWLSVPGGVPVSPPKLQSAGVAGTTLALTFDEALDASSVPAPGAFRVTVEGTRRHVASGGVAIDGKTVTLTLTTAVARGNTVTVGYTRPSANPLRDDIRDKVESFADKTVTNDTGVDPEGPPGNFWAAELTVGKVGNVYGCVDATTIPCSSGLKKNTLMHEDTTYQVVQLANIQGSLVFSLDKAIPTDWTLHLGNRKFPVAGAQLVDATIAAWSNPPSWTTGQEVSVWLSESSSGASGAASTAATSVTGVSVVSDPGADDIYGLEDTVSVRVTFSEPVAVTGAPRLKIKMDPGYGEKWAAYAGGTGTNSLTFTHEVVELNLSTAGIAVLANTLALNGGSIRTAGGGADAALAHDGLAHDTGHKVDWRVASDTGEGGAGGSGGTGGGGAPRVSGVTIASDPGDDDTYRLGDTVRVRVAFNVPVSVTGTPRIAIDMDPASWGTKHASYASGSGTKALVFAYTVVEPNYAPQGLAVLANSLEANGGAVRSASSGTAAALAHTGLGHDAGHKVDWRPTISVADATAREGTDANAAFEVSLSRAFTSAEHSVTVDYATADGTATAGEDYTATSGTLTFAAGETTKTVNVPVLDDAVDEGSETFTFRLSNAAGAHIADGEATGTITNDDPLQKMWLSRFGRTVADHVTGAVSDRLATPLSGAQVTVGGQSVNLAEADDGAMLTQTLTAIARAMGAPSGPAPGGDPGSLSGTGPGIGSGSSRWPGTGPGSVSPGSWSGAGGTGPGLSGSADAGTPGRIPEGRELLLGSAFHLAREGDGVGPNLAAWGRVTVGGFDGEERADDGTVRIDGDVTTGILGADAEWNRLLAGVAVSVSEGEGTFSQPGVDSGTIESTMTAVSPYARLMVTDRVSVWGLAGWGTGDMTIVQAANDRGQPERITRTDIEMRLVAAGGRGALLEADEAGGFDLGLKADAFYVETEAEPISNEGSTTAVASRVRLALEGSRAFEVGEGGTLTPGLEVGLRHDGGDAETGTGVELGGRVSYTDADSGLSVEARVRGLIAHEDSNYREWGASGAVRLAPGARGRGLSFSLAPTYGAASSGVDRLWSARDAQGLAPGGTFEPESRLAGELGYGLALFGDRFTGTPNVGFGLTGTAREYRIGWRLTSVVPNDPGFEVNLDATRRESANDNAAGAGAEHGVMLRGAIRW